MDAVERIGLLRRWLEGTDIALLELTSGQETIRLQRDAGGKAASPPATSAPTVIPAPGVGIFRRAHPSRPAPLVQPGQHEAAGDVVGLLQIGALLLHVRAPAAGMVLAVPAEDGVAVGYGAPLVQFAKDECS